MYETIFTSFGIVLFVGIALIALVFGTVSLFLMIRENDLNIRWKHVKGTVHWDNGVTKRLYMYWRLNGFFGWSIAIFRHENSY